MWSTASAAATTAAAGAASPSTLRGVLLPLVPVSCVSLIWIACSSRSACHSPGHSKVSAKCERATTLQAQHPACHAVRLTCCCVCCCRGGVRRQQSCTDPCALEGWRRFPQLSAARKHRPPCCQGHNSSTLLSEQRDAPWQHCGAPPLKSTNACMLLSWFHSK